MPTSRRRIYDTVAGGKRLRGRTKNAISYQNITPTPINFLGALRLDMANQS